MEKVIVVSTNNNPDYYAYSRYIKHAWNMLGWKVCVIADIEIPKREIFGDYVIRYNKIEGLRSETMAQALRLYVAYHFDEDDYLMVSDMDLLPLSDYWHPNVDEITSYGHDLTDFTFIPMGYIGMKAKKWREVMNLTGEMYKDLERDAKELKTPYAPDWETWWNFDWELLTKRLQSHKITHVKRGRQPGSCYALGRVDRGQSMAIPYGQLIDAHLENHNVKHPEKWSKFINLFESIYGKI